MDRVYIFEKEFLFEFSRLFFPWCKAYRVVVGVIHHGNKWEFTVVSQTPFFWRKFSLSVSNISNQSTYHYKGPLLNRIWIEASLTNIVLKIKLLELIIRLSRDLHIKSFTKAFQGRKSDRQKLATPRNVNSVSAMHSIHNYLTQPAELHSDDTFFRGWFFFSILFFFW